MAPDTLTDRAAAEGVGSVGDPDAPARQRFTLAERVRRRKDYLAIYDHGTRLSGSLMTVFVRPNTLGLARLGIAATRKIGSAVRRNRAKRRVRELYRRHKISGGIDVVVIPRREFIDAPLARIEADFLAILKRRGVVPR
jgi:ribonuclease P protein component